MKENTRFLNRLEVVGGVVTYRDIQYMCMYVDIQAYPCLESKGNCLLWSFLLVVIPLERASLWKAPLDALLLIPALGS